MGRSGHLSGATVALELLPSEIELAGEGRIVAVLDGTDPDVALPKTLMQARLGELVLRNKQATVPLAAIVALAEMQTDAAAPAKTGVAKAAPSGLPSVLRDILTGIADQAAVDEQGVYRMALVLSMLTRSREAYGVLSLLGTDTGRHPAILALSGYLALQVGDVETGRRSLAKAALASRGTAACRGVLHFTQHVLLVHQFNG